MDDAFFCLSCAKWRPAADRVDCGPRQRAKCRCCMARIESLTAKRSGAASKSHAPHALKSGFIRWAVKA